MAKEQVVEEVKEEGLTLEKFEEASEEVKKVTQETKLVYSEYFSAATGNKVYFRLNASPGWMPKVLSGLSMMSGWKTMKNYSNSSQKTTAGQPPVRTNWAVGVSYSAEP